MDFKKLICLTLIYFLASISQFLVPLYAADTSNTLKKLSKNSVALVGDTYFLAQYDDWSIKCIKAPDGQTDPCQLYQQLFDINSNPVADIHIFILSDGGNTQVGASLMTPLETLLTENILFSIDNGPIKIYEFSFCNVSGCVARMRLTEDDLSNLKLGNWAEAKIYSARNPNLEVTASLSLKGFTAAFKSLNEIILE
ncbi:MAG: invasion associated locus B family protein [Paracoccaceae bacterium]|nr:invasion associated locus B family protein [Paracoccaceae bacterium]